jgi:hypothetical protein
MPSSNTNQKQLTPGPSHYIKHHVCPAQETQIAGHPIIEHISLEAEALWHDMQV